MRVENLLENHTTFQRGGRRFEEKIQRSDNGRYGEDPLAPPYPHLAPTSNYLFSLRQLHNSKKSTSSSTRIRSQRSRVRTKKEVKKSDLIHVSKSPNFCKHNPKKDILGTKDRKCNKSSSGNDSCSVLCCGRGYETQVSLKMLAVFWRRRRRRGGLDKCDFADTPILCVSLFQIVRIKEKCQCKFVWCCYVKCKTCEKELYMHSCK